MLDQLRNLVAQLRFRGMEAALDAEIARAERGRQRSVGWPAGYRQNRYSFGSIAPSLRQWLSRPLL
jgi:hypothetical protein